MKHALIALIILGAFASPFLSHAQEIPPEQLTPANGWSCTDAGMNLGKNCTHTDGRIATCRTLTRGSVPYQSCTITPTATPTATPAPTTPTTLSPSSSSEFVPLTSIPAVQNISSQGGLSGFFNYLYVLAVGAAAVIAVLQFVRAGILYAVMSTGVVEKREARHLMVVSVMGLLLVLSPALVFGIINPDILSLRIGITPQNIQTNSSPSDCSDLPDIAVIDRAPTARDTWPAAADPDNYEEQCCARQTTLNPGTLACEPTSTQLGGGTYCKCSTIQNKWHLPIGNIESAGLVIKFQSLTLQPQCTLGANDQSRNFFATEDACMAAYDTPEEIKNKLISGDLLPYVVSTINPQCGAAVAALKANPAALSVEIVVPRPICHEQGRSSARMYFVTP